MTTSSLDYSFAASSLFATSGQCVTYHNSFSNSRTNVILSRGEKYEIVSCANMAIKTHYMLPTISTVLENIIFIQLSSYFNDYKLLFQNQYGFRPKHSTEKAALELVDRMKNPI